MRGFGYRGRIDVLPHGVDLPGRLTPLPAHFTVGYLGAYGPDKGVRYLLAAWKRLAYKDATLLLGGRDSTSPWTQALIRAFGGGNVHCTGWVDKVEDFYAQCSLYCQPSVTEGFGIEVLEAMAKGRMVVCSQGAGAADLVFPHWTVAAGDAEALAEKIEEARKYVSSTSGYFNALGWRGVAEEHSWDKVRARYQELWRGLLE
jgi:glycosyltransferase involved in cell wall biosynthesis